MKKLDSLRAAVTRAIPKLADDPDKMLAFIDEGVVESNASRAASYRLSYVARLVLLDFSGSTFALMAAITDWAKCNQPELVQNPERRKNGIAFEADVLNHATVDLSIRIHLTEGIVVAVAEDGSYTYTPIDDSAAGNVDTDSAAWLIDPAQAINAARRS